jgi:predicted anti-sigma-YlaC factor YlaD
MRRVRPSMVCDRVRSQISLELDEGLSQLERAMVAAHLERCSDCLAYESEITAFTQALREAPLEPMSSPVSVRKARRFVAARLQVGVAAAVAVAALGAASQITLQEPGSQFGTFSDTRQIRYPSLRRIEAEQELLNKMRSGRRIQLDGFVL